jgi:hypothetical protein
MISHYCAFACMCILACFCWATAQLTLSLRNQYTHKTIQMKANESKSIHATFTTRRETCPPVHINNVQLRKQLGIITRTQVKTLYK